MGDATYPGGLNGHGNTGGGTRNDGVGNGQDGKDAGYVVLPQWHSAPSKIRVIVAGAGAAGLLMAYKMQKLMVNYELQIYEKNPKIGGTWYENRYPGCSCDVPAHAYTYSFEPNPDWSAFYASSAEIQLYFERFAAKYDLDQYIKLRSKVLSAKWIEEKGIYEVDINVDGIIVHDWCNVFVNGTGFLNSWKWPEIEGLHDFAGKLVHSANWDNNIDWKDKTVAVIGTGSSAIQMVPQLQKTAKHVTAFMRSVTWISPAFGLSLLLEEKKKESDVGKGKSEAVKTDHAQYYYTETDRKKFRDDPEYHLEYRRTMEGTVNSLFDMFIAGSETSKYAKEMMSTEMERRIGPGNEELKARLIPTWSPGCRRITPGDGYLEALVQPNVTPVHKEITKIVPEGVIDEDGKLHQVDILACATGFNIAFAPPFEVQGVDGVTMKEEFEPEPYVYLALAVPKFPNYFVVNGVRGNWAQGSALPSHEVQVEYILKCISKIQAEDIRAFEVKREPVMQLYEHIDEWHKQSVWDGPCKSWYKNNIPGGKLWIWAGSALHYIKTIKEVKFEHFDIRHHNRNMWAYLGNGRIEAEVKKDIKNLAPYMRNEDIPWSI